MEGVASGGGTKGKKTEKTDDFIDHSPAEGRAVEWGGAEQTWRRHDEGESPLGLIKAAIPQQSRWWQNKLLLLYEPHLVVGYLSCKKTIMDRSNWNFLNNLAS